MLCSGDCATRWAKANLQDVLDLRAHFNDMRSGSKAHKRKRYEDAGASEEDEDGNVVRQLNMDDMDVDDEVDSLGKSQDNILSQLSKTCKQYTPNTSKSGYKKARKHFKTVCEILGEICDEAEEESSSCGESSQSEDEDESKARKRKHPNEADGLESSPKVAPSEKSAVMSGKNLFVDSSSSDSDEDDAAGASAPERPSDTEREEVPPCVFTFASLEEQIHWHNVLWPFQLQADS